MTLRPSAKDFFIHCNQNENTDNTTASIVAKEPISEDLCAEQLDNAHSLPENDTFALFDENSLNDYIMYKEDDDTDSTPSLTYAELAESDSEDEDDETSHSTAASTESSFTTASIIVASLHPFPFW